MSDEKEVAIEISDKAWMCEPPPSMFKLFYKDDPEGLAKYLKRKEFEKTQYRRVVQDVTAIRWFCINDKKHVPVQHVQLRGNDFYIDNIPIFDGNWIIREEINGIVKHYVFTDEEFHEQFEPAHE